MSVLLENVKKVWQKSRNSPGPTITIVGIVSCLVGASFFFIWKVGPASDFQRIFIVVTTIGIGLSLILTGINAILKPPEKEFSYVIFGVGASISAMIVLALYPALSPEGWYWPALWTIGGLYLVGISALVISAFLNTSAKLTETTSLEDRLKKAVANTDEKETEILSLREDLEEARTIIEEKEKVSKEEAIPDDIDKLTAKLKENIDEFAKELNETTRLAIHKHRLNYEQIRNEVENYRQRMEKEKVGLKEQANMKILKNLLEPLGNIDRALVVMKQTRDATEDRKYVVEGIEGMRDQLCKVFESEGAGIIEPVVGEEFDYERHEAVDRIETAEYPEDRVMEVKRRGFWITTSQGVVTEQAKVVVSKRKVGEPQQY